MYGRELLAGAGALAQFHATTMIHALHRMKYNPDFELPRGILESLEQEDRGVTVPQLDALVK